MATNLDAFSILQNIFSFSKGNVMCREATMGKGFGRLLIS